MAKQVHDNMDINIGKIASRHIVSVSPNTKAKTALRLVENSNLSIIPVIDDDRLVGIVSDERLKEKSKDNGNVMDIMQRPLFVEKSRSIDYAIKYIMRYNINRVPVVESSIGMKCIGIVTASQLLKVKKSMQK